MKKTIFTLLAMSVGFSAMAAEERKLVATCSSEAITKIYRDTKETGFAFYVDDIYEITSHDYFNMTSGRYLPTKHSLKENGKILHVVAQRWRGNDNYELQMNKLNGTGLVRHWGKTYDGNFDESPFDEKIHLTNCQFEKLKY